MTKPQYPIKGQVVTNIRGVTHVVEDVKWEEVRRKGQWRVQINGLTYSMASFNQYFKA